MNHNDDGDRDHPLAQIALTGTLTDSPHTRTLPSKYPHARRIAPELVDKSQKKRLLIATADAIAEHGYAVTTIESITSRAGVSKKTFYKFFPSKEDAFLAAYEALETVLQRVTAIAAEEATFGAKLDAMISHYLAALTAAPSLTRLFLIEAMAATPAILRARARGLESFVTGVQQLIAVARTQDPRIEHYPDDQILALLGGINELCVYHITESSIATLPTLQHKIRGFAQRFLL